MKWRVLSLFLCVLFSFSNFANSLDIQSLLTSRPDRAIGLPLSEIDVKREEKAALLVLQKELKKISQSSTQEAKRTLTRIDTEIKKVEQELGKEPIETTVDLLKKKIVILNERKQNIVAFEELWKDVDAKIAKHVKLVDEIIEFLAREASVSEKPLVYSWGDLKETKDLVNRLSGEIEGERVTLSRIKQFQQAAQEEVGSLAKQIDVKRAEKDKIAQDLKKVPEKEDGAFLVSELQIKADLVNQELNLMQEKKRFNDAKDKDLERDICYSTDQIFLLKQKLFKAREMLLNVQKSLVVNEQDVEKARKELEVETSTSVEEKIRIAKAREAWKKKRTALNKESKELEKSLDVLKKEGKENTAEGYVFSSHRLVLENESLTIDHELDLLEAEKDNANILVQLEEARVQSIETLYLLSLGKDKVDEWLSEFKSKKQSAESFKKILKERQHGIIDLMSKINKEQEALLEKQKDAEKLHDTVFKKRQKLFHDVLSNYKEASSLLGNQKFTVERNFSKLSEILLRQEEVTRQYAFILRYLESQRKFDVWKRSANAISMTSFFKAMYDAESFLKDVFWDTPSYLSPFELFNGIVQFGWSDYVGILLFFFLFFLLFFFIQFLLVLVKKGLWKWFGGSDGFIHMMFVRGIDATFEFGLDNFRLIFTWSFIYLYILLGFTYFKPLTVPYWITIFYLSSIPILMYLSHRFLLKIKALNQQLSFVFVAEKFQNKVVLLLEVVLYATSLLLPLRQAFLCYVDLRSPLPEVVLAAYTLILVAAVLFFFNKEDILRFITGQGIFLSWLRMAVENYYYPVFSFFMLLLILSNPYIGYSNLAWYLAFAVPASVALAYGLLFVHYLFRTYTVFLFIKEEDSDVIDKFEHAKTYYGFAVVVSFLFLVLIGFVILARIWGFEEYNLTSLWQSLSEDWVISLEKGKLGLIEVIKFALFVTSGFVANSFINTFVLNKLFDLFRTEPGAQNTISRIAYYATMVFAMMLGLSAINLSYYVGWFLTALALGVGFGMRDQISDYFAGFLVLIERPIEIGHFIQIDDIRGTVKKISARSTTIRTARNFYITIPNRDLTSKMVINWGKGRYPVGYEINVLVAYDSNLEEVKQLILDVMKNHPLTLRVPAPVIRFEEFEANGIQFYIRGYISARRVGDLWIVQSEIRSTLLKTFKEKNIVVPFPQTVIHMAKNDSVNDPVGMSSPDTCPVPKRNDGE